jgi:hypothetical protein
MAKICMHVTLLEVIAKICTHVTLLEMMTKVFKLDLFLFPDDQFFDNF